MIDFHRAAISDKALYEQHLFSGPECGCEYAFANLYMWGKQEIAFIHGCVAFFSHFHGKTMYPYPLGSGDRRAVVEEMLADARDRGIPLRITGMNNAQRQELESWFPNTFQFIPNRDGYDYVYHIDALADLKGRKLQKKRNHFNRFCAAHPDYRVEPLSCRNFPRAQHMVNDWYVARRKMDPLGDYLLESVAMVKAFRQFDALGMEGIVLMDGEEVLAVTMASRLSADTFDVHFEKAREDVDGAYAAINCEFARYLRLKHPEVKYLNREDDMGLEGLRKAKLSYQPDHLIEKHWACVTEDILYED